MKIYGNKPPENQEAYLKPVKADQGNAAAEKASAERTSASDRVNLSGKAKEIAELKGLINQLPDVRAEKIQTIEKAITNGTYKADSLKIAGKIIDELV